LAILKENLRAIINQNRMNLKILYHLGRYVMMLGTAMARPENWRMYYKETMRQMNDIGIGSLVIVCLISIFIGAVTAVQFAYQLDGTLVPRYYIGYIVRDSTIIELAPTITCLVLAGKVGSNMAAEIGGMRQKEHIDAMEIMGVNTAAYLVRPKVLAALIVIPMLVAIGAFVSVMGGYIASVPTGLMSDAEYVQGVRSFFDPHNVTMMFVKALVFAFILTSVSCYQGYHVKGGSIELGRASTNAVVFSNILILLSDYMIAVLLT
jgi:phospholipid/cholesterol/gamma-HCH transport system permease protein